MTPVEGENVHTLILHLHTFSALTLADDSMSFSPGEVSPALSNGLENASVFFRGRSPCRHKVCNCLVVCFVISVCMTGGKSPQVKVLSPEAERHNTLVFALIRLISGYRHVCGWGVHVHVRDLHWGIIKNFYIISSLSPNARLYGQTHAAARSLQLTRQSNAVSIKFDFNSSNQSRVKGLFYAITFSKALICAAICI